MKLQYNGRDSSTTIHHTLSHNLPSTRDGLYIFELHLSDQRGPIDPPNIMGYF